MITFHHVSTLKNHSIPLNCGYIQDNWWSTALDRRGHNFTPSMSKSPEDNFGQRQSYDVVPNCTFRECTKAFAAIIHSRNHGLQKEPAILGYHPWWNYTELTKLLKFYKGETGRFAYKSIRQHRGRFAYRTEVVSPTRSESIRLHWSRYA